MIQSMILQSKNIQPPSEILSLVPEFDQRMNK